MTKEQFLHKTAAEANKLAEYVLTNGRFLGFDDPWPELVTKSMDFALTLSRTALAESETLDERETELFQIAIDETADTKNCSPNYTAWGHATLAKYHEQVTKDQKVED